MTNQKHFSEPVFKHHYVLPALLIQPSNGHPSLASLQTTLNRHPSTRSFHNPDLLDLSIQTSPTFSQSCHLTFSDSNTLCSTLTPSLQYPTQMSTQIHLENSHLFLRQAQTLQLYQEFSLTLPSLISMYLICVPWLLTHPESSQIINMLSIVLLHKIQ